MKYSQSNEPVDYPAEHILYKVYWRLCLEDIIYKLGFPTLVKSAEAKKLLHEFHKRMFDTKSISGQSHAKVSRFIQEVCIFWAQERGIFVRTKKEQPLWIEWMDLADVKHLL